MRYIDEKRLPLVQRRVRPLVHAEGEAVGEMGDEFGFLALVVGVVIRCERGADFRDGFCGRGYDVIGAGVFDIAAAVGAAECEAVGEVGNEEVLLGVLGGGRSGGFAVGGESAGKVCDDGLRLGGGSGDAEAG